MNWKLARQTSWVILDELDRIKKNKVKVEGGNKGKVITQRKSFTVSVA